MQLKQSAQQIKNKRPLLPFLKECRLSNDLSMIKNIEQSVKPFSQYTYKDTILDFSYYKEKNRFTNYIESIFKQHSESPTELLHSLFFINLTDLQNLKHYNFDLDYLFLDYIKPQDIILPKQTHIPLLTEQALILFDSSCHYNKIDIELIKTTLEETFGSHKKKLFTIKYTGNNFFNIVNRSKNIIFEELDKFNNNRTTNNSIKEISITQKKKTIKL